jgi:hypothetical protein
VTGCLGYMIRGSTGCCGYRSELNRVARYESHLGRHWRKEQDPEPGPDPRIWIHIKMPWIRNTG